MIRYGLFGTPCGGKIRVVLGDDPKEVKNQLPHGAKLLFTFKSPSARWDPFNPYGTRDAVKDE